MTSASMPMDIPVTLIGHPFATVGMGEQLRSYVAACQAVHLPHAVLDIYRYASRGDPDHHKLVEPVETTIPAGGIRIFHINGDEVEPVMAAFEARGGSIADGYNIIVPAWELPAYPTVWADQLRKFNEIWALSHFIEESLAAVGLSSVHIGQPVEVPLGHFLPRRYFGIRESAFTILHFFDLSSYASRKNPEAVLQMFEAIKAKREFEDIQLVLKVKKGDQDGADWLDPIRNRIPEACLLSKPMSALETRSLINCCDCFVSLHRSEGFGRGTGEAMFLGRLAMATAWSGNMDYMTRENSLLVDYDLVPVGAGEYPFGEGQHWASARVGRAVELLDAALDDRDRTRIVAANGRRAIRLDHGYRAVGLRIMDRVAEIAAALVQFERRLPQPVLPPAPAEDAEAELSAVLLDREEMPTEPRAEVLDLPIEAAEQTAEAVALMAESPKPEAEEDGVAEAKPEQLVSPVEIHGEDDEPPVAPADVTDAKFEPDLAQDRPQNRHPPARDSMHWPESGAQPAPMTVTEEEGDRPLSADETEKETFDADG